MLQTLTQMQSIALKNNVSYEEFNLDPCLRRYPISRYHSQLYFMNILRRQQEFHMQCSQPYIALLDKAQFRLALLTMFQIIYIFSMAVCVALPIYSIMDPCCSNCLLHFQGQVNKMVAGLCSMTYTPSQCSGHSYTNKSVMVMGL